MRMRFNPSFFAPDHGPHTPAEVSGSSQGPASRLLYSPAGYQSLAAFLQHSDFPRFEQEYRELVDRIPRFAAAHADRVDPPLSSARLAQISADCEEFKHKLFARQGEAYDAHRTIMYGTAKEALTAFTDLLADESLALQKRLDAVVNLTPQLRMCTGGVMTELVNELHKLRTSKAGIRGAATQMMKRMVETAVLEHVRASHELNPATEVHLVNFYLKQMASELGLSAVEDPFADSSAPVVTPDLIQQCRKHVYAVLKPGRLIANMADEYFARVKGATGGAGDAPLGSGELQQIREVKQQHLDPEYGQVDMNKFIQVGANDDAYRLAETPGGIAEDMTISMHRQELIDFDKVITLLHAPGEGADIMQLGHLFWTRDQEGRCDPLEAKRLFEVSPQALRNRVDIAGDDLADVLANMARHILEHAEGKNLQAKDMPDDWLEEFLDLVRDEESVNPACAGQVLLLGAAFGKTNVVRRFFEDERVGSDHSIESWDQHRRTPLLLAAMHGQTEVLNVLLQRGASLRATTPEGNTALHLAAARGHVDVIRRLIEAGARTDSPNGSQNTAAMLAAEGGHTKALDLFIQNDKAVLEDVPLAAARSGQILTFRLLLDSDPAQDLNALRHQWGRPNRTVLMEAARLGRVEMVRMLLVQGAHPDVTTDQPERVAALHLATLAGQTEAVLLMLEFGAEVDLRDGRNSTAVMHAAASGNIDILRILIDRGADVNARDNAGATPLMLAAQADHAEAVASLLEGGARVDPQAHDGRTAAIIAAEANRPGVLAVLFSHGALKDVRRALTRPAMFTGVRSLLANLEAEMRLSVLLELTKGLRAAIASGHVAGLDAFVATVNDAGPALNARQRSRLLSAIRRAQRFEYGLWNSREYTRLKQSNPEFYQNFKAMKALLKSA